MHKTNPDGSLVSSSCDFCQREWNLDGEEIMIEGHQGSLICLKCLSTAYADVVLAGGGFENQHKLCTMCLEEREQPEWESPLSDPDKPARVCLRCIKQSATALEKDPDTGWKRPGKA
jgi:hypothetical protein